jgi:LacI family transcriptional regulator, gluconate utilization system Gnt-I transcriptional repressor
MVKRRRPGLRDIADRVGVTRMTVSRYLRDPSSVSPATAAKIAAAVEATGYVPNLAPSLLARAASRTLAALIPSLTNQVFSEVVIGMVEVTEAAGYQLMMAHYGYDPDVEERALAGLLAHGAEGVILSDRRHTPRTLRMLEAIDVPVVEIMDSRSPALQQAVGYDNVEGAYDMVGEMIRRGRRHILYLAFRLDPRTRQREEGYARALREHGLEPRTWESAERSSYTLGADLMRRILAGPAPVDAIFCTNDDVAIGAYYECLRQGVAVPSEIAIAGFHGHDVGRVMTPRLASVVTPRREIGRRAAAEVLARLRNTPATDAMIDLGYRIDAGETL